MNPFTKIIGTRQQYFEIQDYPWCPQGVREGVTDYLGFSLRLVPLYRPSFELIHSMRAKSDGDWIDLCAGSGGGSLPLFKKLKNTKKMKLILTDLYPHKAKSSDEDVEYYQESVDARNVPENLKGFRTLFTSFHHLPDPVAHDVLKDAWKSGTPIGAFEFTERNLYCMLMTAPTLYLSLLLTPFIFPWKLSRFFWTYLIPLIPIVATIDIIMSCYRTRTPEELKLMVRDLNKPTYRWEIGQKPASFGFKMTYIVGMPV